MKLDELKQLWQDGKLAIANGMEEEQNTVEELNEAIRMVNCGVNWNFSRGAKGDRPYYLIDRTVEFIIDSATTITVTELLELKTSAFKPVNGEMYEFSDNEERSTTHIEYFVGMLRNGRFVSEDSDGDFSSWDNCYSIQNTYTLNGESVTREQMLKHLKETK